jgi:hypothetical protein
MTLFAKLWSAGQFQQNRGASLHFRIYFGIEKIMDSVHGSWTGGAPGSTVDWSGASTEAATVHGRRTARRAWGLACGAGEGEEGRARPRDGSSR